MESSLYLLVPLSVALVFLIGWVFWRALHGGQFDDLDRPGYSILDDDEKSGTDHDFHKPNGKGP